MLFESTIHMHAKGKVIKVWFSTFSVYFEDTVILNMKGLVLFLCTIFLEYSNLARK